MFLGLVPFGLIFVLAGLTPLLATVPIWNWFETRNWQQTQGMLTQTGDQLMYEYLWNGQKFAQTTYSGEDDEDGHSLPKSEYLLKHKPGETVEVFVNPDDPAEAVLSREIGWSKANEELGFILTFALMFGIPGLLCVYFGMKHGVRYIRELRSFKAAIA